MQIQVHTRWIESLIISLIVSLIITYPSVYVSCYLLLLYTLYVLLFTRIRLVFFIASELFLFYSLFFISVMYSDERLFVKKSFVTQIIFVKIVLI